MEEVFDLRKVIFVILHSWRKIVVFVIICSLLGGAFQVFQNRDIFLTGKRLVENNLSKSEKEEYDKAHATYDAEMIAYKSQMKTYSTNQPIVDAAKNQMLTIQKQIDASQRIADMFGNATLDDSFRLTKSLAVTTSLEGAIMGPSATISVYRSLANTSDMTAVVSNILGKNISEKPLGFYVTISNASEYVMQITTRGVSEEACITLMSGIFDYLQSQYPDLEKATGAHILTDVNADIRPVPDLSFYRGKLEVERETNIFKAEYANQKKSYEANSILPTEPVKPDEIIGGVTTVLGRSYAIRQSITYLILGAVGGGLAAILFILLAHLFSNKIYDEQELKSCTNAPVIEVIPSKKKEA